MSITSERAARKAGLAIRHVALIAASALFAFPFVWMLCGAFKTNDEIWRTPYALLPRSFDLAAVARALPGIGLGPYIANSLFVGILGTLLTIAVSVLFAYAVVFLPSRWTELLFGCVMLTYMLPSAVTYVPSYVILSRIGLLDTHSGFIFSNLANVFAVFYLRQCFKRISRDFVDAARIDGSSELGIVARVILPFNASSLCSIGVLTFIGLYNSYMWPSIMLRSKEKYLVSQGLRQFFIQDGAYGMNWSGVMLAGVLAILPILAVFLVARKWFLSSIAEDSGVKF